MQLHCRKQEKNEKLCPNDQTNENKIIISREKAQPSTQGKLV